MGLGQRDRLRAVSLRLYSQFPCHETQNHQPKRRALMTHSTPETWTHILSLMAAIIVSDDRVREDEIQSFINNTRFMARELNQDIALSDDLLRGWLEAKRATIAAIIMSDEADTFIIENIMALEPFAPKQFLLNCLISIAASDAEIHYKEADLINLAAAYWDLTPIKSQ